MSDEYAPESANTYPLVCRVCKEVQVVPTGVKTAKNEPGKRWVYLRCRACHQRWQDVITTEASDHG